MAHTSEGIYAEFSDLEETIHQLKVESSYFRNLYEDYNELFKVVEALERKTTVINAEVEQSIKQHLLHLKDQLYQLLMASNDKLTH